MASISRRKSGNYQISFYWQHPYQTRIYTTIKAKRDAERVAENVQALIDCKRNGLRNSDLESWLVRLQTVDAKLYARLVELGLADAPPETRSVEFLVAEFIAHSTTNWRTRERYRHAGDTLCELIDGKTDITTITVDKALDVVHLMRTLPLNHRAVPPQPYAASNANRTIRRIKTFFNFAEKMGWIVKSPFRFAQGGTSVNNGKMEYVPRDVVVEVIEECGNPRWAAVIALGRFAGCRGASELYNLRWDMVDFRSEFVTLHALKKEGREDTERAIPMCKALVKALRAWREVSPPDAEMVFPKIQVKTNVGIPVEDMIKRCGIAVWKQPWYNLRRSFCSDIMESGVEPKMYEAICGHSFAIGMKHYQILHPDRQQRGYDVVKEALNRG